MRRFQLIPIWNLRPGNKKAAEIGRLASPSKFWEYLLHERVCVQCETNLRFPTPRFSFE
jgi:hypothetical protein